jgi:hypothetical protein
VQTRGALDKGCVHSLCSSVEMPPTLWAAKVVRANLQGTLKSTLGPGPCTASHLCPQPLSASL